MSVAHTHTHTHTHTQVSRCGLEVDVTFENVMSNAYQGKFSAIAPLRVLSFDIEVQD